MQVKVLLLATAAPTGHTPAFITHYISYTFGHTLQINVAECDNTIGATGLVSKSSTVDVYGLKCTRTPSYTE